MQRDREKEQKQQRVNGAENILLKDCTIEGVWNYDKKSSGKLDSGAARNFLHTSRISNNCSCIVAVLGDTLSGKNLRT